MVLARALDVRVLDAQQHGAAVTAGVEEIEDCRPRTADVEKTGRGGGEAELHAAGECTLSRMKAERGYTLIEVLIALVILGIVITTTIAMFAHRSQYLRESSETILVWQVMWNEMEIWRRLDWAGLESQPSKFHSDLGILAPLGTVDTDVAVKVSADDAHVKNVVLTVLWEYDKVKKTYKRNAHISLLRADTGGSNLW
jgi:prepilin-type N-terminal cleavage/methylation domain-containing protein